MNESMTDVRDRVRTIFEPDAIQRRVQQLGEEIGAYYAGRNDLLILGTLKGSFMFMADLVRHVTIPHEMDFVGAASYGKSKTSSGHVRLFYDPVTTMSSRPVLLLEDIVDTGHTLQNLVHLLQTREPASLDICTLLHKRKSHLDLEPRFVGFDAPDEFLVGYGLDYAEQYRYLPFVGSLKDG